MDWIALAVITFVGSDFSLLVPAAWKRLATVDYLAVFLGSRIAGIRSSMALSRFAGPVGRAASAAREDHAARFLRYEVLAERQPDVESFLRIYRWHHSPAGPIVQQQLFRERLVLTCSRAESSLAEADEGVFQTAIESLRVAKEAL